ncbi:MAG: hypothetical protein UHY58_04390 [Alistipes sp.]|nr:hypothetical protein [Alistipes sp.]
MNILRIILLALLYTTLSRGADIDLSQEYTSQSETHREFICDSWFENFSTPFSSRLEHELRKELLPISEVATSQPASCTVQRTLSSRVAKHYAPHSTPTYNWLLSQSFYTFFNLINFTDIASRPTLKGLCRWNI